MFAIEFCWNSVFVNGKPTAHLLRLSSQYVEAHDLVLVAEKLPGDLVDLIETLEKPFVNVPLSESTLFSALKKMETLTRRLEDFDVRASNAHGEGKWIMTSHLPGKGRGWL